MKKLLYFNAVAVMLFALMGASSCGKSEEDNAREDSIRVADSLRKVDSIRVADSIEEARVAEEEARIAEEKAAAIRAEIDDFVASKRDDLPVKFYDLKKVIFVSRNGYSGDTKTVTIKDFESGGSKTITLEDSEHLGKVIRIEKEGSHQVVVSCHWGGSGPFCDFYLIDIENGKVVKHWSDA